MFDIFDLSIIFGLFNNSFFTTLLVYLNQQEQVLIYQYLIYLLYFLNCLKLVGQLFNLSISNLSTAVFRLAKFDFSAKPEVSICQTCVFVA